MTPHSDSRPGDVPSPPAEAAIAFRHKALAALLASTAGALGAHRWYLGRRGAWVPVALTAACVPLLLGVRNWYQTPAFFVLMIPVVAGFIEALVLALMPDERFDARYNAGSARRNRSGWDAVLVAIGTLLIGTTILMTTIVLLFQTLFEHLRDVRRNPDVTVVRKVMVAAAPSLRPEWARQTGRSSAATWAP